MQQRRPVRRAPLSVSDKAGIVEFVRALSTHDMELLSTEGTARLLAEKGLPVTEVSDYAGFPKMTDGHVKILHPKIHGRILSRHGQDDTIMEEHQIQPIDMMVANLYPFAQATTREDCSLEDAVESIDIGGPTAVRSAAKNHKDIAIVVKSSDYGVIIKEMDTNESSLTLETHFDLAIRAFEHTAAYDSMTANYFGSMVPAYHDENKEAAGRFPRTLNLNFIKKQDMRYGGNSHQQAAFYIEENVKETSIATATQVQGKALSYSNITDADAAPECVREFAKPACVVVKHTGPCDVAIDNSIFDAYDRAYKTGPTSAFGSIVALNHELDVETAQVVISCQFIEVIIAPPASEEALKITATKQNIRVLTCDQWGERVPNPGFKHMNGGLLVQDRDLGAVGVEGLRVVTKRQPTEQELRDALFCWKVARFVKSSAIVHARNSITISVGAGQISRVYSAKIVGIKAADEGLEVKDSSMTSDALFPLHDDIDATAAAGMTCIIQPGSSIRDDEMIAAADERSIAVLFTDTHRFRR